MEAKDNQLRQKDDQLRQKDDQLRQKDDQLQQKDDQLRQKDDQLQQKDDQLQQKDDQLQHERWPTSAERYRAPREDCSNHPATGRAKHTDGKEMNILLFIEIMAWPMLCLLGGQETAAGRGGG